MAFNPGAPMGPQNNQAKPRNSFSLTGQGAAARTKKQGGLPNAASGAIANDFIATPASAQPMMLAQALGGPTSPASRAGAPRPHEASPPINLGMQRPDLSGLQDRAAEARSGGSYNNFTLGGVPGMSAYELRPDAGGGVTTNAGLSQFGQGGLGLGLDAATAKAEALQNEIKALLYNGSPNIAQRFSGSALGQDLAGRAATPQGFTAEEKAANTRRIAETSGAMQRQGGEDLSNALAASGFGDSAAGHAAKAQLQANIGGQASRAHDDMALADAQLGREQQNIGTQLLLNLLGMQQGQELATASGLSNFQFPIVQGGAGQGGAPGPSGSPAAMQALGTGQTITPQMGGLSFDQGAKQYVGNVPQGQVAQLPGGMVNPNLRQYNPTPQNLGPLANTMQSGQMQLPLDANGFLPGTQFAAGAAPSPQQIETMRGNHLYRALTGQDIPRLIDGRAMPISL